MMGYSNNFMVNGLGAGMLGPWLGVFLLPLIVWSFVWKGWALWKAAKADSVVWFVILMVVNTLGILEILYIFAFSKNPKAVAPKSAKPAKKSRK